MIPVARGALFWWALFYSAYSYSALIAEGPEGISVDTTEIEQYFAQDTPGVSTASMALSPNIEVAISNLYALKVMSARALEAQLISQEDLQWLKDQAVSRALSELWLNAEVERRLSQIEWEVLAREKYLANEDEFWEPERLSVRHIILLPTNRRLVDLVNEAEGLRNRVLAGEHFSDIAREYSEDGSAPRGGVLGDLAKGDSVPAFEEVVFKLNIGEVSEVFLTQFGAHLAIVDQRLDAKKIPFEEVRQTIISKLRALEAQEVRKKITFDIKSALTKDDAFVDKDLIEAMRTSADESD